MAMPSPPRTFGRFVDFAYTRSPGFDTRRRPAIERSRLGPNLRSRSSVLPTWASSTLQSVMYPSVLRIAALFDLSFENGQLTSSWYAEFALRSRVSMSATGSVIVSWALALPRYGVRPHGVLGPATERSFCLEREPEVTQQCTSLVIGRCGGDDGDIHTADTVDPVLIDLVEHRLLREAEGVVTVSVELAIRESAEVADTGKSQRDHAIDELPHPCSTHGHVGTDGLTLTQLELCDGLASPGHDRLLAGDESQIVDRTLDQLGIARRVTHTH